MISKKTKLYGFLNLLFIGLVLGSVLTYIFINVVVKENTIEEVFSVLLSLNGPSNFLGTFLLIFFFIFFYIVLILLILLIVYYIFNVIHYIKLINNNISKGFMLFNIVISIILISYSSKTILSFVNYRNIYFESINIFPIVLFTFLGSISGIIYSINALRDRKRLIGESR